MQSSLQQDLANFKIDQEFSENCSTIAAIIFAVAAFPELENKTLMLHRAHRAFKDFRVETVTSRVNGNPVEGAELVTDQSLEERLTKHIGKDWLATSRNDQRIREAFAFAKELTALAVDCDLTTTDGVRLRTHGSVLSGMLDTVISFQQLLANNSSVDAAHVNASLYDELQKSRHKFAAREADPGSSVDDLCNSVLIMSATGAAFLKPVEAEWFKPSEASAAFLKLIS